MAKIDPVRCVLCGRERFASVHDALDGHAFTPPAGAGARQGGYLSWVMAFIAVAGMLAAWFLTRGDQ